MESTNGWLALSIISNFYTEIKFSGIFLSTTTIFRMHKLIMITNKKNRLDNVLILRRAGQQHDARYIITWVPWRNPSPQSSSLIFKFIRKMAAKILITAFLSFVPILLLLGTTEAHLQFGAYNKTCPHAEHIVYDEMTNILATSPDLAGALLRLHYVDCFVRVWKSFFTFSYHKCLFHGFFYL